MFDIVLIFCDDFEWIFLLRFFWVFVFFKKFFMFFFLFVGRAFKKFNDIILFLFPHVVYNCQAQHLKWLQIEVGCILDS